MCSIGCFQRNDELLVMCNAIFFKTINKWAPDIHGTKRMFVVNIGKSIIHPSTSLQDGIENLKQAVQAYTTAITDLQAKLSVELFKRTQNLESSLDSYFSDFKSDLGMIDTKLQSLVGQVPFHSPWNYTDV